MKTNWIIVIMTFLATYVGIWYFLGPFPSPFYYLAPVAGFFMSVLFADWLKRYFSIGHGMLTIFLLISILLAFYLTVSVYYAEQGNLQTTASLSVHPYICISEFSQNNCAASVNALNAKDQTIQYFAIPFWDKLRTSAFLSFMLAAVVASIMLFISEKIPDDKPSN